MIANALLRAEKIGRSCGNTPALREAGLSVTAGEVVAVMGPSGSGKPVLGLLHFSLTLGERVSRQDAAHTPPSLIIPSASTHPKGSGPGTEDQARLCVSLRRSPFLDHWMPMITDGLDPEESGCWAPPGSWRAG